eukprot:2098151-Rhodomonas_salina.2
MELMIISAKAGHRSWGGTGRWGQTIVVIGLCETISEHELGFFLQSVTVVTRCRNSRKTVPRVGNG